MSKTFLNFTIIFFAAASLLMLFIIVKDIKLIANGVKTEGTVFELRIQQNPNIRLPFSKQNVPVISFFTPDYKSFQTLGCADCYKIGDKVVVIYDPNNPSNAEVYSSSFYTPIYYLVGFIVFLIIFYRLRKSRQNLV